MPEVPFVTPSEMTGVAAMTDFPPFFSISDWMMEESSRNLLLHGRALE